MKQPHLARIDEADRLNMAASSPVLQKVCFDVTLCASKLFLLSGISDYSKAYILAGVTIIEQPRESVAHHTHGSLR